MKKKLFVLFFVLLLIVSGCGSKSSTEGESKAPEKKGQEGDQKNLSFLILSSYEANYVALMKGFEESHPGYKISYTALPFRQMIEGIEVQMSSKKPDFDILLVDGPLVANYTVKGYLEPLDQYFSDDLKQKWIDSSLSAGTYDGKLMAAPMNTSADFLYYNKDLFEAKGITPPSEDPAERWTWEQVVETAKQLTEDTNGDGQTDTFGFTFRQVDRPYQLLPLANSLGAQVIGEDGLTATGFTNSPKMIEAGTFYYDLFNTWKVSPKITSDETAEYFATGKVGMFIGASAYAKIFQERGVSFGYAPFPYFEGKEVATPTGSFHLGISSFSNKKEGAAEFIKYATAEEGSQLWFDLQGEIPAHIDVLQNIENDAKFDTYPNSLYKIGAYEAKNTAVPRPVTPAYLEWESLLLKAYEDMKTGVDPKTALDNAAQQSDRMMKKYSQRK